MFTPQWQQMFNQLDERDEDYLTRALQLLCLIQPSALNSTQDLTASLSQLITTIDSQLSTQLSTILAHREFCRLEALWRNVHNIASLPSPSRRVKVKLIDFSWQEISQDLNNAVTVERSYLYNLIGNRELNTLGGEPFGLFVIDHYLAMEMSFDDPFDDLYTLELIARLGELCLCPFTLSITDDFFGGSGIDWLSDTQRIEKILAGPDYSGWNRIRQHPSMKFIAIVLPKIKQRHTYREHRIGFVFNERCSPSSGLWGNAGFAFASIAIREYNRLGWFGFMKSRWQNEHQGALINVPNNSNLALASPTPDIPLFGELARFYAEQGFIPICHSPMTDKYFFFGNQSLWQTQFNQEDKVGSQIQAMLMSCRIAHYLKVQIRNMIGSFRTAAECQRILSNWIDEYSSNLIEADEKTLAKYPLSKGIVKVREVAGESEGRFVCELTMQPQYQFDHVCGEIVLSTDLGTSASHTGGNT